MVKEHKKAQQGELDGTIRKEEHRDDLVDEEVGMRQMMSDGL